MNIIQTIAICSCFIIFSGELSISQDWHGLRPLHSTCEDVKRVLGVTTCEPPGGFYEFEGESIHITFSKRPCEIAFRKAWNVPPETVLSIERLLKKRIPLSKFNINLGKYKKEPLNNDVNTVIYENQDEGISFWTVNGIVSTINYTPTSKDKSFLCHSRPELNTNKSEIDLPTFPFDRYGDLPFNEEREHLDLLARELKEYPTTTQLYIVVYAAQRICQDEAQVRGDRAKDYLAKTYSIDPNRIKIITGEKDKGVETVIYVVPPNLP